MGLPKLSGRGRVEELRRAMLSAVSPDDIRQIVLTLVRLARDGDPAAAREVLDRVFGRPAQQVIQEGNGPSQIVFVTSQVVSLPAGPAPSVGPIIGLPAPEALDGDGDAGAAAVDAPAGDDLPDVIPLDQVPRGAEVREIDLPAESSSGDDFRKVISMVQWDDGSQSADEVDAERVAASALASPTPPSVGEAPAREAQWEDVPPRRKRGGDWPKKPQPKPLPPLVQPAGPPEFIPPPTRPTRRKPGRPRKTPMRPSPLAPAAPAVGKGDAAIPPALRGAPVVGEGEDTPARGALAAQEGEGATGQAPGSPPRPPAPPGGTPSPTFFLRGEEPLSSYDGDSRAGNGARSEDGGEIDF